MKKKWIAIIGSGVLVASLVVSGTSFAKSDGSGVRGGTIRLKKQAESDFPALAKLTPGQAAQDALGVVPGQVLKTELEDENGFLVYGVEVVTADKAIVDVKVDAGSGKVLAINQDKTDEHGRGGYRDRDEEEREHDSDSDRDRED